MVQNKLHWAISQHTAAELIAERADSNQPNMGLITWKGAKVRRVDVTVAKNYLRAEEIEDLNRIVTMYLDYAEDQAKRRQVMHMRDWREKLDAFLKFNEHEILGDSRRSSRWRHTTSSTSGGWRRRRRRPTRSMKRRRG